MVSIYNNQNKTQEKQHKLSYFLLKELIGENSWKLYKKTYILLALVIKASLKSIPIDWSEAKEGVS